MFKRQPTETQLIFLTLLLVLLMGIPTIHTLTDADSDVSEIASVVPAALDGSRQPASVAIHRAEASKVILIANHNLDCKNKLAQSLLVKGEFVQIKGQICQGDLMKKKVEIVNKSNGYTAEVFDSGVDKYQTDLIQLKEGSNTISIRYTNSVGKVVEDVLEVKTSEKSTL